MSLRRVVTRASLAFTLVLAAGCGGGSRPPHAAQGPGQIDLTRKGGAQNGPEAADRQGPIRFEDLPVSRLDRAKVPRPNGASPSLGATSAPVVIQVWSDFECPFCADMHPVLTELMRVYAGKVRLVWHDYPLPMHAHARLAANAGREAYAEGGADAFWKFHDAIYTSSQIDLSAQNLERIATTRAGLDATRFHEGLSSLKHDAEIKQDMATGDAIGVEGTPAFLVNDYFFVGSVPLEIMRVIVDRALTDASAPAAG